MQHWRPASWRVAAEEINYRRFFDINALAAMRMENANCFGEAHRLVFALLAAATSTACASTTSTASSTRSATAICCARAPRCSAQPLYLVVEKILAPRQQLLRRWRVDGTTGYEFMNAVTGLAVDARATSARSTASTSASPRDTAPFDEVAYAAKKFVLETALSAELNVLTLRLDRIAQRDPAHARLHATARCAARCVETIASFPIYRTYVTRRGGRES